MALEQTNPNQYKISCLDDFLLNDIPKKIIKNMVDDGTFPNAFLIEGSKGTGKKTFAKLISQAILCENENSPCFNCTCCNKIAKGIHPDVKILSPDTKSGGYSAQLARNIIKDAYTLPNEGARCIFIIPNLPLMAEKTQNSLLKVIEEPPNNCVFIFTCENRKQVLPTILSRTAIIRLDTPSYKQKLEFLPVFVPDIDDSQIQIGAKISKGGLGDAIEILCDEKRQNAYFLARDCAKEIVLGSGYNLLKLFLTFDKNKDLAIEVLEHLENIFSDILISQKTETFICEIEKELYMHISSSSCIKILQYIKHAKIQLASNCSVNIVFTNLCVNAKTLN